LVVAAILGPNMARWLFAGSALLVVSDLVLTVTRLGPLNRAIAVWTPVAPAADWRTVRGDWSRLHAARTGLVLVAAPPSTTALAGVQSG
jgi:uncharacterized membrane protein